MKIKSTALSLVLALAMVFSTFAMVQTAYADTEEGTPGMVEGSVILGDSVNTADARTVYYAGTAWRVIAYNGTGNYVLKANDRMTLLASGSLGSCFFRSDANHNYSGSTLKSNVDSWYNNHFSVKEKIAVIPRDLVVGAYSEEAPYTDGIAGGTVKDASLWPLSTREACYTGVGNGDYSIGENTLRCNRDDWWLRSPGSSAADYIRVSIVDDISGRMGVYGYVVKNKYSICGVRPAFNLNPSSILLLSDSSDNIGKPSGDIGTISTVRSNTGKWKMTLLDDGTITGLNGHAGFTASRADSGYVLVGGNIKINYSGGQTGENEYVSVFLKDSSGKIVYYGHLAQQSESGTEAALTIPSDIALGTYTVGVFAEQCNGDNNTDYASAISTFDITVVNHSHVFTYSANGPTITATCANTDNKCPLTDCKAILTIAAEGGTYDGTTSFGATITDENSIQGDVKVKYQKKTGESSYGTETETAPTDAGTYKASITLGDATAFVEYTIAKADITPEVNIEGWDYGSDPNTPSVTAESNPGGGDVTYEYYTDEACTQKTTSAQGATVDGGAPKYGGDYWVKATVKETDNYNSGTGKKKFTINATSVTVTGLKFVSKEYDGKTEAVLDTTDAVLEGVPEGVQIASATGKFPDKNVGEGKTISGIIIVLEGKDAGGYKATADPVTGDITAKAVKVTGITASDKTYDGNTKATLTFTGASFEGKIDGDDLSVKGKDSQDGTFNDKNVGTDKPVTLPELELGGADAGNYTIKTDSQTTTTAAITAKEVSVTAEDKSKTYGGNDPELTYTADELVTGDTFSGALERAKGEDVGNYDINQGTLTAGGNYTINYTKGTFAINKATTNEATASIEGWTYGENPKTPSATATYGEDTATFAYSKAADGTYTETAPTDAGTWYVKATVPEMDNYAGAVSDPVEFTITQKEVGLKWTDTELTYNGEAQKPKATATGLVGQDECEVTVDGAQTDANAKTGMEFYEAEATKLSNPNYKLPAETKSKFTIAPKELTQAMISLDSDTIKQDGSEKGPEVTMTDADITEEDQPKQMVEGEDYTLSGDVKSSELGTHVITAEGKGNYTGSIKTSWMMYSKKSSEEKEEGTEGRGDFEVFVDVENNSSDLTVDNLTVSLAKGFLTEEDMARYNEGENVLVYMIFKEQPESEVESTDSSLLGGLFRTEGATDISWYDITVWKKIGSSAATKVHDTKDELSMGVEVPDEYKIAPEGYTREFYLGRAHDGIASILANTSKVKVGFSSSKFSTYALAYKDTKIPEPDPGKDDKKGKGGAKTGDPNDIAELLALMLASGGALGAIGYRRRRETDK